MSYNSTTKYLKLPQWILSDPPQMSDFNTAFSLIDAVGKYIYPVGSIYMSMNSTNPGTLFGGTWARIANGKMLVGVDSSDPDFNDSGKTGGEKEVTLSLQQIPQHHHSTTDVPSVYFYAGPTAKPGIQSGGSGTTQASSVNTGDAGGGKSHNNMPPYLTCYIWQRIA